MSQGIRRPHQAVDYNDLQRLYPPPPEYFETAWLDGPEQIARKQDVRLRARARNAARIPFFERRWRDAGVDPSGVQSVADLANVPTYNVEDIRRSIEQSPPLGDYQAVLPGDAAREPMRLYMSGGTTGNSRPTLYTQWDREVGAIMLARMLYMQGVRPGDVVLNSWSYGTHNGAFAYDEALYRWLNCVVITTGTGNVTSSEKQVELARAYGAKAILTTGDYLLRLAEVAQARGLDPRHDLALGALSNIGDTERLERTFGLPNYQTYGIHEVQTVAVECPARNGLHIFEDAYVIQIVDADTGQELPDGETGCIVLTEVCKTGTAQFRYNTLDLSYLYPREQCACGSWLRRMGPFQGRADNMVKLRGVNVWPEALGEIAMSHPEVSNDYFVRARRVDDRDELLLSVVGTGVPDRYPDVAGEIAEMVHQRVGVRVAVDVVAAGSLDEWTLADRSPKLKRFKDER